MARDLFEEYGIVKKPKKKEVDIFREEGITTPEEEKEQFHQKFTGKVQSGLEDFLRQAFSGVINKGSYASPYPESLRPTAKGAAIGLTQGLGDIGASIGNFGLEGLENATGADYGRIPHSDIRNPNPETTGEDLGQRGGEIAAPFLLPGFGMYKAASAAKTPLTKLLASSGAGGLLGAAENEGNREIGASIGAAIPFGASLTKSVIGKQAANIYEKNKEKYQNLYNDFFKEVKSQGIEDKLTIPSALKKDSEGIKSLYKNTSHNENLRIKRFANNPTLENAHHAQSDLAKIARELKDKKEYKGVKLSAGEEEALLEANNLRKRIKGSLQQHFVKADKKDFSKEYNAITQGYSKEVAPFLSSKELTKKNGRASKIGKELLMNPKFHESEIAKSIPGFGIRHKIGQTPRWVQGLAGGASIPILTAAGVPIPAYLQKIFS